MELGHIDAAITPPTPRSLAQFTLQDLPLEMLSKILSFLDADSLCACSMVNSTWKELCALGSVWKMAYGYRWLTSDLIFLNNCGEPASLDWRQLYVERHQIEKSLSASQDEAKSTASPIELELIAAQAALTAALLALTNAAAAAVANGEPPPHPTPPLEPAPSIAAPVSVARPPRKSYSYRFEQLVDWADALVKRASDTQAAAPLATPGAEPSETDVALQRQVTRLQQLACDCFVSALAGAARGCTPIDSFGLCDAHYKLAMLLAQVARAKELPDAARLMGHACSAFSSAAQPSFCLYENALRHWADALVELARKEEARAADRDVTTACALYSRALEVNPRYALAYYYHGRALRMLARGRRQLPQNAAADSRSPETLYRAACDQFGSALQMRPEDPYVMYEHASTLHDLGLLRDAALDHSEAERMLARAGELYAAAHLLLPQDAWVVRNHADTLYDQAKCLFSHLRAPLGLAVSALYFFDQEDGVDAEPVRALLLQACAKYQLAVQLNPSYANALNSWGLALSTFAKLCANDAEAETHFTNAYEKFARAVAMRPDHQTELCNWAMTLVSHAMKRQRQAAPDASWPSAQQLLRDAKQKLKPLLESDPWTAFCMARRYAVRGREDKCRLWLERCLEKGYLRRATRWQLAYFHNVAHCDWFQRMLVAQRALAQSQPAQPLARSQPASNN